MFMHVVYFWLREDLTDENLSQFVSHLHSLTDIETVVNGHVGTPAGTDRPVIDSSYSYALILEFADRADQDAYQVDPAHLQFVADCGDFWTRVQVYDSVG
jgi:hypothetical protein